MNSTQSSYGQELKSTSSSLQKESSEEDQEEMCIEKPFEIQPLQIQEISSHQMLYLHGDFVLCFSQFQNQSLSRKFHHNNVFRSVRQVRMWKSSHLQDYDGQQSFVEAIVEKSFFSKQDYIGIAQKLIFHGRLQLENTFGEALMRWYQRGSNMIKSIQNQNCQFNQELIEQENLYSNDLMNIIYSLIEHEKTKNDFFQYNILELNRITQQFENTRIGISFGLQCLLGAEQNVAQNIIMRNGVLEYLDNRTVLNLLIKQLSQQNDSICQGFPKSPPSQFDYYQIHSEDNATLSTLDDLAIPCKVKQQTLKIQHNLLQKYPLVKKVWEEIFKNQRISLPYPDSVCVRIRNIEVEPQALQDLIQLRSKHMKDLEKNIEELSDEIGYSIRSMFFIEKFYNKLTLKAKKKRLRRKKGHLNDWEYLSRKYQDFKEKQNEEDVEQS